MKLFFEESSGDWAHVSVWAVGIVTQQAMGVVRVPVTEVPMFGVLSQFFATLAKSL